MATLTLGTKAWRHLHHFEQHFQASQKTFVSSGTRTEKSGLEQRKKGIFRKREKLRRFFFLTPSDKEVKTSEMSSSDNFFIFENRIQNKVSGIKRWLYLYQTNKS